MTSPIRIVLLSACAVVLAAHAAFCAPSDFLSYPIRTADQQDFTLSLTNPSTIAVRMIGSRSETHYSAAFLPCDLSDDLHGHGIAATCVVPAVAGVLPTEFELIDDTGGTGTGWLAEPLEAIAPGTVETYLLPTDPDTAVDPNTGTTATVPVQYLKWRIPVNPAVRWFEFQCAAVDLSPTGSTAPVWMTLDSPTLWTYCALAGTGAHQHYDCARVNPVQNNRCRVRGCNYAGCSAEWTEEGFLSCLPLTLLHGQAAVGGGCPCTLLPSPAGCIP